MLDRRKAADFSRWRVAFQLREATMEKGLVLQGMRHKSRGGCGGRVELAALTETNTLSVKIV